MSRFLFVLLALIAGILLFSVPYLLWYGRVKGTAEEPGRRSDLLVAVVWFCALGVALYERSVLQWMPFGGWPLVVGVVLMAFGLSARLLCRHELGRYYLPQLKIQPGHRLVTSGPYHYLRHPMYAGSLVGYIGLTIALGSILGTLLMAVGILAAFAYRIWVEEALLAATFGQEWQEYARRTKYRMIPPFL